MHVRLAFSVAVQVDADVLLIDEVLAVGDAAFQQKCFEEFERMKRARQDDRARHARHVGGPALLPPRDADGARRDARRSARRNGSRAATTSSTSARSCTRAGRRRASATRPRPRSRRPGSRTTRGARSRTWRRASTSRCAWRSRFHAPLEDPIFAFNLLNEPRHTVFATTSEWSDGPSGRFAAGETVVARVRFDNWLAPMRYTFTPSVARAGLGADALDLREDLASLDRPRRTRHRRHRRRPAHASRIDRT